MDDQPKNDEQEPTPIDELPDKPSQAEGEDPDPQAGA
jgi:hypothetical protein